MHPLLGARALDLHLCTNAQHTVQNERRDSFGYEGSRSALRKHSAICSGQTPCAPPNDAAYSAEMDSKGAEETRTFATVFALRSQILAACFEEVARRLEMGHEVYLPLLSAKVFRKFLLGHDLTSEQAGYVGVLLDMPPPPSIDGAAPAP